MSPKDARVALRFYLIIAIACFCACDLNVGHGRVGVCCVCLAAIDINVFALPCGAVVLARMAGVAP